MKKKIDIFLRPIIKSDINDRYLSWFEDKVNKFPEFRNLTREKVIEYIEFGISRTYTSMQFVYIGNNRPFSRLNNTTDLVTIIGDKDYWGKGIND